MSVLPEIAASRGVCMVRKEDSLDNPNFFEVAPDKPKRYAEGFHVPGIGWLSRFSRTKSLYALLMVAAHIDRREDRREVQEIRALAARTKTLRRVPTATIDKYHQQISADLASDKVDKFAEFVTRRLRSDSRERRESAFMHALDILYADQTVTDTEWQFIKDAARWLLIEPERARELNQILQVKNTH